MALMLRQACETILSEFDLDPYHADINDSTKYLQLYTPCGKTFAIIHGVKFGRLQPTKPEIDFATTLLSDWLFKNKKKIEKYIAEFEKLQPLLDTPQENKNMQVICNTTSTYIHNKRVYRNITVTGVKITQNNVIFELDATGKNITSVCWKKPNIPVIHWVSKIKLDLLNITTARKLMKNYDIFMKQQILVDNLLADINTCNT